MKELQFHPLSEIFPMIPAAEMKDLVSDILSQGLQSPIILYEGKILDGRNRHEACQIAEVKPRYEDYKGYDPIGFVISANLKRRHLTVGERAAIAVKLVTTELGGDRKSIEYNQTRNSEFDRPSVAKTLGISVESVHVAHKVKESDKRLFDQMADGKISLHAAEKKLNEKKAAQQIVHDHTGLPIPKDLVPLWKRVSEVQQFLTQLSHMRGTIRAAQDAKDLLWGGLSYPAAEAELAKIYTTIECAKPYAVCPRCQGSALKTNCTCCKGRGVVSQYLWNSAITREEKLLRSKLVEKLTQ